MLGCGGGCLAIALALAQNEATVAGFDTDAAAIAEARRAAAIAGVADRVTFEVADRILGDTYDLVYAGIIRPTAHPLLMSVAP